MSSTSAQSAHCQFIPLFLQMRYFRFACTILGQQTIWCAWPKGDVATTGCCCSGSAPAVAPHWVLEKLVSFYLFSKALDGAVARCSFKYTLSTCSRKMFLALMCSTLLPSAPLAQLPCLTTAQRPAAHPQALDDTARWCWREILTALVLVKICPFGQVQLLLARGFPHSSA